VNSPFLADRLRDAPRLVHARRWLSIVGGVVAFAFATCFATAAEVIPPRPANHFNDLAKVVPPATATQLNRELQAFERETSSQLLVAIYPRMQSESSVEDYAVRVAQQWGVGQKGRNNGAVLFVFMASHDVRIVTGYGVEGALPDALAKRIVENEIIPRFRANDFAGGLTAGVRSMMAAVRGEYRGTGLTQRDAARGGSRGFGGSGIVTAIIVLVLITLIRGRSRRRVYDRRGRHMPWLGGPGSWGGGLGGGGWGSGGGSSGGGGTFSAGGGSFGGGGAGGKW
jgi:uncharacterized protein